MSELDPDNEYAWHEFQDEEMTMSHGRSPRFWGPLMRAIEFGSWLSQAKDAEWREEWLP